MRKNWEAIRIIWLRELLRFWRDKSRIAGIFIQPLVFLFIFGAGIASSVGRAQVTGYNYMQFMYPGVIGMTVMITAIFSGISIVWDREFGFLREILVAPIPRWTIVLGKALGGATVATIQGAVLFFLSPFLGLGFDIFLFIKLIPLMMLLSFSVTSFGILVASKMTSQQGFQFIVQALIFPMIFLSGAIFPLTNPPLWMKVFSTINPVTYGVDAFRQILLEGKVNQAVLSQLVLHNLSFDILLVSVFGLLILSLATYSFSQTEA